MLTCVRACVLAGRRASKQGGTASQSQHALCMRVCSCVVWDTGCRNRKTGAPRALWYGLEFIRFALNRCWSKPHSSGSGSGGDGSGSHGSSSGSSSSSSSSHLLRAHIRGHDVSRDLEAACRRCACGSVCGGCSCRCRCMAQVLQPCVAASKTEPWPGSQ
jgi:hypothetical protein